MSPDIRTPHIGRPKYYQLAVRQRQGDVLKILCKVLGPFARFDPRCKDLNNDDKPSGGGPSQPDKQPPAASPTTSRQPQQPTTDNPPPITTSIPPPPQTAAPTPSPTQTPRTTDMAGPPPSTVSSSRQAAAGTPPPGSEQPRPSQTSSSPQPAASSLDVTGTSLALSTSETPSQASSLVVGTPTQSTFTSVIVTRSGGGELTITSTGVTLVTPRVPAPTDLDGRYDPPGSVGASSKSTNIGAIVGAILGVLALLVLCALAFLLYQRRKRKRSAPSSEFIRRYGHTTLNTPRDPNSPYASNLDVSQMRQAPDHTQNAYNSFPYLGEKR